MLITSQKVRAYRSSELVEMFMLKCNWRYLLPRDSAKIKRFMNDQNTFGRYLNVVTLLLVLLVSPQSIRADDKAGDAYNGAVGSFKRGLWKQAVADFKEYFSKYPRHSMAGYAHYVLGLSYFNLEDYASATRELEAATGSVKGLERVRKDLYLGQALMLKEPSDYKSAEGAFTDSLKALGFDRKGFIINRKWDEKSVKDWLDQNKEPKQRTLASDVFVGLLEATYLQQDWKSIVNKVEAFEELIKGTRIEQRTRVLLGEAHSKSQNHKEAAVAYEAASLLKGSDSGEALFRLGLVRLNHLSDYEGAAKNFHTFTGTYRNDAKRADAAFNEALCYQHSYYGGKEKHLADAIRLFGEFVKTHKKHEMSHVAQFYEGKLQHIQEDWNAAVQALKPLLGNEDPALSQLVFLLGDSYHQKKDWEQSAKFYMQFAKGNEKALNADVALHNAGVAYSNLKKPDNQSAIAAYELLESKCPSSPHIPSAQLKLGIIHFETGRFEQAQRPLQKIPANHPLKADAEYFLAWTDLDNQKPLEAARRFKKLREKLEKDEPDHQLTSLSHLYQGIAEFEARRFAESARTLKGFVAVHEEHVKLDEAAFNQGLALMEMTHWEEAIKSFESVPDKSDIHDRALYQSAWSKRSAGKHAEAVPYYKDLLKNHPDSQLINNVTLELAEVEFETGGEKGSIDSVKRLEALLKNKPAPELRRLALYRLGIVQFEQKSFLSSAKAFEELLKDAPKDLVVSAAWQAGEARRQLAVVAKKDAQEREYKAALINYELATKTPVKEQGNQSELQEQSLLRIGQTRASLEEWNVAQEAFDQFIRANPKHKLIRTAHLGLGWAVHNQEKYPEAIDSYEKVVQEGVRDDVGARAQFLLGECYLEQKQLVKARTEFSKVEVLYAFPLWQSKALYEMGRAFAQDNQNAQARKVFMQLIEKYPETSGAAAAKDELKRLN